MLTSGIGARPDAIDVRKGYGPFVPTPWAPVCHARVALVGQDAECLAALAATLGADGLSTIPGKRVRRHRPMKGKNLPYLDHKDQIEVLG
jgi:hypothetical protein